MEVHHSVCFLLVVPCLARLSRLCRGPARPCSRRLPARRAVFVFFPKIFVPSSSVYSYILIGLSLHICINARNWEFEQVDSFPVHFRSNLQIPENPFVVREPFFFTFLFVWHRVCFHNRVAVGPDIFYPVCILMHAEWCCRCCHRVPNGETYCWFIESASSFFLSLHSKHDLFLMYPLAVLSHLRSRLAYILCDD